MILRFLIISYIFKGLTIAVTPVCQISSTSRITDNYRSTEIVTLTCIKVTDYVLYEKWYYKSPCQHSNWKAHSHGYDRKWILNINDSNLHIINQNFTKLIYNCHFEEIQITNSNIQTINMVSQGYEIGNLQKLNLSFNNISKINFSSLYANSLELMYLNLDNNKLVTITASNFQIVNKLKILSIGYNNLYTIGNSSYDLPYIEELHLNNNNLSEIQFLVFKNCYSLKILNLANNYIEYLDGNLLTALHNLEIVNFEGNKIKLVTYRYITGGISTGQERNKPIINLYLQNNPLSLVLNETYLDFHNMLFKLDLSQCNAMVLEDIFENITSLQILKLTDSPLRRISPKAFSSLSMLNELDLSNNKLTTLNEFTFTGLKNLTTLYLINNPINVIFRAFTEFTNLFSLTISVVHCDISNNTFYDLTSVHEINFINSSILKISDGAFSKMDELEILRLENTTITEISSKAFQDLRFEINESNPSSNKIKLGNNFLRTLERNTFVDIYNVNYIEIDNNLIESINPGAFTEVNMIVGESTINLTNNNLIHIVNDTFLGISHLNALLISNNKLTTIEINAFRFLNDLQLLDLSQNNLQVLNHDTFSSLKQLKSLYLTQNKLTILSSNLFVSLVNLETLVLSNNNIKSFPLGTFNNLSSLTDLNLANNNISEFQIGSFSNLGKITSLDLSNNNLNVLNEMILYPLHQLKLLNLANNNFSNINYTSLLLHLPLIQSISVNNNNWNCHFLTNMLKEFRLERIDYLFNKIENYTVENVDGIPCHMQNIEQAEENTNFVTNICTTTTNSNNIEMHKEVKFETKHEKSALDVEQSINSNESLDNSKLINELNNMNPKILLFLILFTCIGLLLVQIFSLYKKYYTKSKKNTEKRNNYSEIELLNVS